MRHYCAVVVFSGLTLLAFGCQKKERMAFVATWPTVEWKSIARGGGADRDGFQINMNQRTTGLFPASLAVARVRAVDDLASPTANVRLMLNTDPQVDFLSWNTVFDDLREISEVYPIAHMSMDGAAVSIDSVLNAAEAQRAGLCLIYTQVLESVQDARLRGVLYAVNSRQQLATIHAFAHIQHPIALDDEDDYELEAAEREARDPLLVATRQFERYMRDLLMKLRANNDPQSPEAPQGWTPQYMEPAVWPPIDPSFFDRQRRRQ